jgi:hypothetical protein
MKGESIPSQVGELLEQDQPGEIDQAQMPRPLTLHIVPWRRRGALSHAIAICAEWMKSQNGVEKRSDQNEMIMLGPIEV